MNTRAWRWVRELAIIGAVAAAALLFVRWMDVGRPSGGVLPVGIEAPAFELADVRSGATTRLDSLRGRPVILAFWATHCGPCREELPALERVHREAAGRYAVIGVSSERASTVRGFLAEEGLSFATLSDPRGEVFDAYRVRSIPMTVIIDADGAVVDDFTGPANAATLAEHMERLGGG